MYVDSRVTLLQRFARAIRQTRIHAACCIQTWFRSQRQNLTMMKISKENETKMSPAKQKYYGYELLMITKLQRFYRSHYQQRQIRKQRIQNKRDALFNGCFDNVREIAHDADSYLAKINGLERHASWLSEYNLKKALHELRQPEPDRE